jgi:hypothetical protein
VLALFAQVYSIGILGPVYFYLQYVLIPVEESPLSNSSTTAATLPALLIFYHVPHALSYFHPDLQVRHWWDWIWQLCPVWVSMSMFVLSWVLSSKPAMSGKKYQSQYGLLAIRATVCVIAVINTAVYWYTLAVSGYTARTLFLPEYLVQYPKEPDVAVRTILQYDHICSFGSAFLWQVYQFLDLKSAGIYRPHSLLQLALLALSVAAVLGPGTLLLLSWVSKEAILDGHRSRRTTLAVDKPVGEKVRASKTQ